MTRYVITALLLYLLLAQISGCHFYVDAVPRIIVSSEQFQVPNPPDDTNPNPP